MRILHLTDPHLFASATGELRGERTGDSLQAVIAAATGDSSPPPDAVVVTGDIAQDESRGAYRRFRDMLGGLGVPVYCLPGNHDEPEYMRELLDDPPFQYCGDAMLGGWRLHFLPTWVRGEVWGRLGDGVLAGLEAGLLADDAAPTLIFLHHHPVPTGSRWLDGIGLADAGEFLALIARHPQVRGLIWGHIHQVVDRRKAHCRLLATPSTCRQFRPDSEVFAVDDTPPAWRWLLLGDDGSLDTELHWLDRS